MKRRIIPRETWGAAPPRGALPKIPAAQKRLWLHHSVTARVVGFAAPRLMQQIAFGRGFSDASYTHGVDNDGNIYELRGIGVLGAHTKDDNDESWAIVAIGNFETTRPSFKMLVSIAWLTRVYAMRGWDAKLGIDGGHRDAFARGYCTTNTACPGKHLHAAIRRINRYARVQRWRPRRYWLAASLPILRRGDQGEPVKRLQRRLNHHGARIEITGRVDGRTVHAVRDFQQRHRLKVDGVVGQLTWTQLLKKGNR